MQNLDLPILVVDDAKFSSAVVARALKSAGYRDVRVANNALIGLKLMEERPVSVLIADWLMPEMDGLQLTDKTRQLDEQTAHYTYIILLTAKESVAALSEAFDRGVDDFIYKSDMSKQLLPRVFAADRIADRQNTLLVANKLLIENNRELEARNIIDLETGLASDLYAREQLARNLRHTESRGGATAYLLIGVRNWQDLKRRQPQGIMSELVAGIGRRLTHLVRPLDALCRVGENQFAIISQFTDAEHCTPAAFKRIHEGINLKAFKTTAGYLSAEAGTALCKVSPASGSVSVQEIEQAALTALMRSYETRTLTEASLVKSALAQG